MHLNELRIKEGGSNSGGVRAPRPPWTAFLGFRRMVFCWLGEQELAFCCLFFWEGREDI